MKHQPLPSPEADALAHSQRLQAALLDRIQTRGPLHFDDYWEQVLYAPGRGYYSAGSQKFGAGGDFITAPELGNVFARCLAVQCAQTLAQLGGGEILELGAGSGALCAGLLLALESLEQLPTRYAILERSADLRQRQQALVAKACPHLVERVHWLDEPPGNAWQGLLLANEVVDALAARRFERGQDRWQELRVVARHGQLEWARAAASDEDQLRLATIETKLGQALPIGYCTETQPGLSAWAASVTTTLERGLVLLVDYGYPRAEYYHPQRVTGSLICHYQHREHDDPFIWPGLQDISVNVEFTALAEALDAAGLSVVGFTTQAGFLVASGLQQVIVESVELPTVGRARLQHEILQLTSPAAMGERFHFIGASRGLDSLPLGFSVTNHLRRL